MAKTIKPRIQSDKPKSNIFRWDVFLVDIFGRFGVTGGIIITIIMIFIIWGTTDQKREFIDKFILLKNLDAQSSYIYWVAISFAIVFIAQIFFHRSKIKSKNERINDLKNYIEKLESVHFIKSENK